MWGDGSFCVCLFMVCVCAFEGMFTCVCVGVWAYERISDMYFAIIVCK